MSEIKPPVLRALVIEPARDSILSALIPPGEVAVSRLGELGSHAIAERLASAPADIVIARIDAHSQSSIVELAGLRPDIPIIAVAGDEGVPAEDLLRGGVDEVMALEHMTSSGLMRVIRHAIARRHRFGESGESQKFRAAVEASPAAIYIARKSRITYVNAALAALTGYEGHELVGMDPLDLLHPSERPAAEERRSARRRGEAVDPRVEVRIRTRSGQERWIDLTAVRVEFEGGTAVVGAGIDITDRKQLEERMTQRQRLEMVGRLAGNVAHDFNNLLLVISGETERLVEGLPTGHPLRASADAVATAASRAALLTEQLLAFGRRQVLIARQVDVSSAVADAEDLLRESVGERIATATDLAPDLPLVRVDRARLEQVLVNLATNARDAMGEGGTLTIRTDLVEVDDAMRHGRSWLPGGTWVRLRVIDTGAGIPADVMPHIFEPFYTTKDPTPGSGLGLSTVYGIVKQSGGYVWIDSPPGGGAGVTILLPPVVAPAPAPAPAASAPATATRVLLVDDEEAVRELLIGILEKHGFEVTVAASAEEALHILAKARFDVLLTDVVLPGLSGPELARRLRAAAPATRVLFMSGYTGDGLLDAQELSPEVAFIQKPFGSKALVAELRSLLAL